MPVSAPTGYMSKIPAGLLGFLDIKNEAKYPQALLDQLQPTMELFNWYTEVNQEYVESTGLAAVVGSNATTMVVPAGQLWYVHDYTCVCAAGAGAAIDLAAGVVFFTTPFSNDFVLGPYSAAAANQTVKVRAEKSFFLLAGGLLAFEVRSITLAPTVSAFARITRIRI
jgi:hypothetical protein